jgi:acylphosphatase
MRPPRSTARSTRTRPARGDGLELSRTCRRFGITGKVQGVYFRHSTRLEAERLAITGFARNLPDGSVEVLALGAAAALEELHRWLHHGPDGARVDSVRELAVEEGASAGARFEVF